MLNVKVNQTYLSSTCSKADYPCFIYAITGIEKAKKMGPAFQYVVMLDVLKLEPN